MTGASNIMLAVVSFGALQAISCLSHRVNLVPTEAMKKVPANLSTLDAVGCDGTAVNTGNLNGACAIMEKRLRRQLQWLIRLLHGNELPLRYFMTNFDGPSTGPKTLSGPIGKRLGDCERRVVPSFKAISLFWAEKPVNSHDLSTDKRY